MVRQCCLLSNRQHSREEVNIARRRQGIEERKDPLGRLGGREGFTVFTHRLSSPFWMDVQKSACWSEKGGKAAGGRA
jgi:hypothetical protein